MFAHEFTAFVLANDLWMASSKGMDVGSLITSSRRRRLSSWSRARGSAALILDGKQLEEWTSDYNIWKESTLLHLHQ